MRVLRYLLWAVAATVLFAAGLWVWALHTTSGARLIWSQVEAATDGALSADEVDGDISGGLVIDGVTFRNDSLHLAITHLTATVDIELFPLAVNVEAARAESVSVETRESSSAKSEEPNISETLRALALPIPVYLADIQVADIAINTVGSVLQIDGIELVALWHEDIRVERLRVQKDDVDVSIDAHIDLLDAAAFSANANARVGPELTGMDESISLSARAAGNLQGADVDAEIGDFAVVDATVQWEKELDVNADVLLRRFAPSLLGIDWPEAFHVDGTIHASIDEARIVVTDSRLTVPAADAQVDIDAELDRHTDQVMGNLRWSSLRWPLPEDQARVRSDVGNVRLSGTIDSWTVTGDVAVGTAQMPDGRFTLDGGGTRYGARARILEGSLFGGNATGRVEYEWRAEHPWTAELDIAAIQLASFVPDWPGSLSGHVEGSGAARPFSLQATLEDVSGLIRGAVLTANGAIDIEGKNVIARELRIDHGDSGVLLDGSLTTDGGLNFTAHLAEANAYVDEARGSLDATGHMSVTDSALALVLSTTSPVFAYGDTVLNDIELNIAGTEKQQTLNLSTNHQGADLLLGLSGVFDDWQKPLESTWRGNIGVFEIGLGDEHSMLLADAAPLNLSKDEVSLHDFCVAGQSGAQLCANFDWQQAGNYAADLVVQNVPVKLVEHLSDTGLNFEQLISGQLNWRNDASVGSSGDGNLTVSEGRVSSADDASVFVQTGAGTIDFTVEDGALLSGDLNLPMPGTGSLTGSFAMLDVRQMGDSGIVGSVDVDISDVTILSLLTPLIDSARGHLRAHAELKGTLEKPVLTGDIALEGASLEYLPIGLTLQDVNLAGHLDEHYQAELTGSFRSGDGAGRIVTSVNYSDVTKPGLRFQLLGDDLTLINVPDVFISVNSDIDIVLDRETLSINGSLVVPAARISPSNVAVSRISESEDVVIVEGELIDAPEETVSDSNLDFSGKLDVTLGDSVVIDLDRARATVSGGAVFEWQGDMIPVADGRYNIAGSVAAFGQVLDITEGVVRFPKVQADSPLIRIVAEREIYGNTQVKQAGVRIDGPVNRLSVEPFTIPMTTEERALTLLVTGSDFDYEQGVGAIDFGTYIAPRLFVSYGVGVFERENIVSARFDLSRRFGIKASSGSKESGVDFNYRFEN